MASPILILYEDADSLAVLKPPGIMVHKNIQLAGPEAGEPLLQALRRQLGRRLFPVHRLDRPTSGVLLLAKSSEAASHLGRQFMAHSPEKLYFAMVRGWAPAFYRLEKPLAKLDQSPGVLQAATTVIECRARIELPVCVETYPQTRYSLLALRPESGRRHQLRRHLKFMNHPIIGDTIYGRGAHNRYFRERFSCTSLLLHHLVLRWNDREGQKQQATAPFDASWLRIAEEFGWSSQLAAGSELMD